MRIALIQMNVKSGDKDHNIEHAFELLGQAAPYSDLLILPELWTIGYDFHNFGKNVTRPGDPLIQRLSSFAAYHRVTLEAGTLPVKKDGAVKNTGLIFGTDGRIRAHYSKRHLFYGYREAQLMKPGTRRLKTNIQGVEVGMAVCYELYFPKLWRKMAKSGVTLVMAPASWPAVHVKRWQILTRARAVENGMCIAAVNMVGSYHGIRLGGHSCFINPLGEAQAEGDFDEHIYYTFYDEEKYRDLGKHLAVIAEAKRTDERVGREK